MSPPPVPAARKLVEETGVAAAAIQPTGKDGRVTKGDVLAALSLGPAPQRRRRQARRAGRPARRAPTARSGCG